MYELLRIYLGTLTPTLIPRPSRVTSVRAKRDPRAYMTDANEEVAAKLGTDLSRVGTMLYNKVLNAKSDAGLIRGQRHAIA